MNRRTLAAALLSFIMLALLSTGVINAESEVEIELISSSTESTVIRFKIASPEQLLHENSKGGEIEILGEGDTSLPGAPALLKISRLIAIPAKAKVTCRYIHLDSIVYNNLIIDPASERKKTKDFFYGDIGLDPETQIPSNIVELGEPALFRDLRVIRLTVNPVKYYRTEKKVVIYNEIEVTLNYHAGDDRNVLFQEPVSVSRSFLNFYKSRVINFESLNLDEEEYWGTNLIIAPDNATIMPYIQALADWKNRRGIPTVIATLEETGSTAEEIKMYLEEYYINSDPQLAFLTLIGDCAGIISVPASNDWGDYDYSRLNGDDILADVAVGRYSCANSTQLMTEITKVISYESTPFMLSTDWYKKGAVVAGHASSGLSTIQTKKGIRVKALMKDYTTVDTLWYNMAGSVPSFTSNALNEGIGFYNFRGFIGMNGFDEGDINALTNYNKLAFVVTITCSTGDIVGSGTSVIEEFFRVGTPNNLIGAIAAVGTATGATHTRQNNCIDNGIFGAFFDYGIFEFGNALNNGKLDLYLSYPDNPTSVENFCEWNNLIGDPSCQLWTDIPSVLEAEYPAEISAGTTSLSVIVRDTHTGAPLPESDVCLYGDSLFMFCITDSSGAAFFDLPNELPGEFQITCCRHNYIPFLSEIIVDTADVYVSYSEIVIDDDILGQSWGNGDGNVNPGEVIELGVSLRNYGDQTTATNINSILNTQDPMVSIADSTQTFPDLLPGSESEIIPAYVFSVSENSRDGSELPFYLEVTAYEGVWNSYLPVSVQAPDVVYQTYTVQDSNGIMDPGDIADLEVSIFNDGALGCDSITGSLYCENDFIEILQSESGYGNVMAGASSAGNSYSVEVSPEIVTGAMVPFEIRFTGANGYLDTTSFIVQIGTVTDSDPSGPDEYGYYALDNTDIEYSGCPEYDWIEIDPNEPGHQYAGIQIPLTDFGYQEDDTELEHLPFDFVYYGESFDQISVCSNGWMAMGDQSYYTNFRNWYIPSTLGPYSLISPFWDDLILGLSPPKRVYKYYDADGHRYIVEWNVINYAPGNYPERFQAVLFDPLYHQTGTGDGMIIFQYETVYNVFGQSSDNHFATIGIKSPDNLSGLEYSYWNHYSPGAAQLESGRAIKFTTDPPIREETALIEDLTIVISGNNVELTWAEAAAAQIYYIYKSGQPYFTNSAATLYDSAAVSQYTDENALINEAAFYRVTWE